ncbi:hypothetical protein M422DRAFT_35155 [Sphaerobolus stellatus SS14]|uniref:Uncharacterized protein n=1 Tax=Sphaerobolus stellatus (strain SS14) TaxID=990650 RepID=A0A0C9VA24_SPHS4|nr:hypothetical protein M422DRAFT_35155 [Sphaerobolus stellatus SS14]
MADSNLYLPSLDGISLRKALYVKLRIPSIFGCPGIYKRMTFDAMLPAKELGEYHNTWRSDMRMIRATTSVTSPDSTVPALRRR